MLNIDEYFFSLRRSYLVVASEFHCFGALFVVPISTFRISTARSFGSGCRSCCVRHKKCLSGGRGVWGPRRGSTFTCSSVDVPYITPRAASHACAEHPRVKTRRLGRCTHLCLGLGLRSYHPLLILGSTHPNSTHVHPGRRQGSEWAGYNGGF